MKEVMHIFPNHAEDMHSYVEKNAVFGLAFYENIAEKAI